MATFADDIARYTFSPEPDAALRRCKNCKDKIFGRLRKRKNRKRGKVSRGNSNWSDFFKSVNRDKLIGILALNKKIKRVNTALLKLTNWGT